MNDRLPSLDATLTEPLLAQVQAQISRQARRVTSYDVALAAGVSQSAVSRCFKPGASVSKSTFARVMQAANALAYTPNAAARSLTTQRSNLVAVVLLAETQLHYPEVLSDLSGQFGRRGMRVLLFSLARESDIQTVLAELWQHQVDGAVVAARLSPDQVAQFEQRRLPFVLFNCAMLDARANGQVSSVLCNQVEAGRTIAARLAAAGHRRFAMIDGPLDSSIAQERKRGVATRLAELGLPAALVVDGGYDYASGGRGLREIVQRLGTLPDAVMCANDLVAIGCLDTARVEMKLQVPRDLSITGFDGIASSSWLNVQLTTLRQPMAQMTLAVADVLGALIEDDAARPHCTLFPAQVIEGATARLGPVF